MALKYGIFPSKKTGTTDDGLPIGDRTNDAEYLARKYSGLIGNGVLADPSTCGQVQASGQGLKILIKPIDVWINGWYAYDLNEESITLAEVTDDRVERVFARLNHPERKIEIITVSGSTAPNVTRTNDIYDLALADITLKKGQTVASQSNISDLRLNNTYCGIVSGLIKQIDTSTLLAQMESWFSEQKSAQESDFEHWYDTFTAQSKSDFDTWFTGIKNVLDSNTAGHLLNMINAVNDSKGKANGIAGLNSKGAVPPEQGGSGETSLADSRNVMGLGKTTGPLPIKNGGTEASTAIDAIKNLGLSPEVISTGGHYILLKAGSMMNLRIYGASANSIPTIPMQYRPHTIDATGFAWILGSSPQAGILIVSGYNGNVSSCVMSGPDVSDTECRGSVAWIAN